MKFLIKEGSSLKNIYERMMAVYGEPILSQSQILVQGSIHDGRPLEELKKSLTAA